jgi:hypothetical protein
MMRRAGIVVAASALLAALANDACAAPGDVVVPAHRTRDGQWVPANVPPMSGGTYVARRPTRGAAAQRRIESQRPQLAPPLLTEAQPVRR